MNRKSFIDLTALLDVILILFFAVIINYGEGNNEIQKNYENSKKLANTYKEKYEKVNKDISKLEMQIKSLHGMNSEDISDFNSIIKRISIIKIELKNKQNELIINKQNSGISILREALINENREEKLFESISGAIKSAISNRNKGDILFIKIEIDDDKVYKYAYEYLVKIVRHEIKEYGENMVFFDKPY